MRALRVPAIRPANLASVIALAASVTLSGCQTLGDACGDNDDCSTDEYCVFSDKLCGAGLPGECRTAMVPLNRSFYPVCGCDARIYDNVTEAAHVRVDVDASERCSPPPGFAACGEHFCTPSLEHCERPDATRSSCAWLPASCAGAPSCAACFDDACGCTDRAGLLVTEACAR